MREQKLPTVDSSIRFVVGLKIVLVLLLGTVLTLAGIWLAVLAIIGMGLSASASGIGALLIVIIAAAIVVGFWTWGIRWIREKDPHLTREAMTKGDT